MRQLKLYSYWFVNGIFFLFAIIIDKIKPIDQKWVKKKLRQISRRTIEITQSEIHVDGLENVKSENFLIVSNHESIFDPVIITDILNLDVSYIAKVELEKVPLFGYWGSRINALFLDRKNMRQSMKVIIKAIENTKNGENYILFPEGTRNEKDEEFKSGSFKIAQKADVNILPITIRNSQEMFEKNKKISKANVQVKIHPEVKISEYKNEDIVKLAADVEQIIRSFK